MFLFLSHCDFRFRARTVLCFFCWSVLRRNSLLFSRKGGRLEQSGNVRKACHRTWAGEGTALSDEHSRDSLGIGGQQRGGERKLLFSFAYGNDSSLIVVC
jgi:hypothetical protein